MCICYIEIVFFGSFRFDLLWFVNLLHFFHLSFGFVCHFRRCFKLYFNRRNYKIRFSTIVINGPFLFFYFVSYFVFVFFSSFFISNFSLRSFCIVIARYPLPCYRLVVICIVITFPYIYIYIYINFFSHGTLLFLSLPSLYLSN